MEFSEIKKPNQDGFYLSVGEGCFEIPGTLDLEYRSLVEFAQVQPLWERQLEQLGQFSEKPIFLLIDNQHQKAIVFDAKNWQFEKTISLEDFGERQLAGVLVVGYSSKDSEAGVVIGPELTWMLTSQSPVFVFEKTEPVSPDVTAAKMTILKNAGIVDVTSLETNLMVCPGVSGGKDHFLVVSGRLPERRRRHGEVDLLAATRPWYWQVFLTGIRHWVEVNHKKLGFKVTDWEEINGVLKRAKSALEAVEILRHGYGVKLESRFCFCKFSVDLQGIRTKVENCPPDFSNCFHRKDEQISYLLGRCPECGGPMRTNPDTGQIYCINSEYPSCRH